MAAPRFRGGRSAASLARAFCLSMASWAFSASYSFVQSHVYFACVDAFDDFLVALAPVSFPERREAGIYAAFFCVEINQCVGCTRQFFTKSFLGDDAAVLAPSSGEDPAPSRYRAGVASMAWRTTR